ncbi:hypothetical protein [Methylobacterium sp. Gmos1]
MTRAIPTTPQVDERTASLPVPILDAIVRIRPGTADLPLRNAGRRRAALHAVVRGTEETTLTPSRPLMA